MHRNLLVAQVLAGRLSVELFLGEVVATSDPTRAARPGPRSTAWDLVLLDSAVAGSQLVGGPGPRGPDSETPRFMLLGDESDDPLAALTLGARAWVPVDVGTDVLIEAFQAVLEGQIWLPATRYADVVERLLLAARRRRRLSVLTARQLQVLQALVNGQTTQETAEALFMSANTVRTHRARLFAKLGVHYALEAVVLAREAGLSPE